MRSVLDYLIVHELARGRDTIVFQGRRLPGDEAVALKMAAPDLSGTALAEVERRLRREAAVLDRVRRPGVVPLVELVDRGIDAGSGDGPVALVTELAAHGTLADRLAGQGPMTPSALAALAAQVATTLAALHADGVVHGDLSTANILLAGPERWWLADLGDAVVGSPGATTGHPDVPAPDSGPSRGTPGFVAPELERGGAVTAAADVHAFGRVLAIAGGAVVRAEGDAGARTLATTASPLDDLVAQATHPDPSARPSAASLAARLATRPRPVEARRAGTEPAGGSPEAGVPKPPLTRDFPLFATVPSADRTPDRPRTARRTVRLGLVGVLAAALVVGVVLALVGGAGPGPRVGAAPPDPGAGSVQLRAGSDLSGGSGSSGVSGSFGGPMEPCPGPPAEVPAGAVGVPGDVGGLGCLVTVVWWPDRAEAERPEDSGARVRFGLGSPGDQLVLGDWDGDGRDTPALYEPATGRVTRFDRWADAGEALRGTVDPGSWPASGVARVVHEAGRGDRVVVDPQPGS